MNSQFFDYLGLSYSSKELEKKELMMQALEKRYHNYKDPWGFDLKMVKKAINIVLPFYLKYFKVRVFGKEYVENTPYMVTSNHTGQVPIDGMLITLAMAYEFEENRILHAMVDRFVMKLPFLADFYSQTGSILGDRSNCNYLLSNNESILVFPEGVRGVSKNSDQFYNLQSFTQGFYRIALHKKVPILPVAVIGAEEMFPLVYHLKGFGHLAGLPTLPLMSNYFPLPSPIDIYFGKPFHIPDYLDPDAPDKELREFIDKIEIKIKDMITQGLKNKRPFVKEYVRKGLKFGRS